MKPRIEIVGCALLVACISLWASSLLAQDRLQTIAARVEAARVRLAQALASAGSAGVPGRLLGRVGGSYEFAPQAPDLPIAAIANPQEVSPNALGPRLLVEGQLDVGTGKLTITHYRLAVAIPKPDPDELDQPEHRSRAAATAMVAAVNESLRPGAMSVTSRSLAATSAEATATRAGIREIVAAYQKAVAACTAVPGPECRPAQVDAIVRQWNELRGDVAARFDPEDTEFKALYGQEDNYDPWRYDRIFKDAASVVALGEPVETRMRALCSGVLIGRDLVLTAAHCFAGDPARGLPPRTPEQLEVWFDFTQRPGGAIGPIQPRKLAAEPVAPPKERWGDLLKGQYSAALFDYAIVRIAPEDGRPMIPNEATPRCLRRAPLNRGDSIYVLGFPRGERARVHDNARVYMPYRVLDGELFARLRLDIEADMIGEPDRAEQMKSFDESYFPVEGELGQVFRVLNDVRDGGQPRMGIIADLFQGNSGGPVFDHDRDQCVVGILNRGMPDTGKRLGASWKQHERVLPIRAILEDLDAHASTKPLLTNGELILK
jgi:trypsin-like peptidase